LPRVSGTLSVRGLSTTGDKPNETAMPTSGEPAAAEVASLHKATGHYPKYVAFLRSKAGVEFRGRILELGAGAAWFTAELSKLPKVVEVIATDFARGPAQAQAPQVFKALRAQEAKIIRRSASAHRLNFRDGYFDFVVCNAVLHEAMNLLQLLREVRRVLKPGGQLVAVREPVKPFVRWRAGRGGVAGRASRRLQAPLYARADYEDVFERAGFSVKVRRASLARGLKYYFDTVVNGLTNARYMFVATRKEKADRDRPDKVPA
jgi:SAM-dependent methyltransferase